MTAPKATGRESATRQALIGNCPNHARGGLRPATSRRVAGKTRIKAALVPLLPEHGRLSLAVLRASAETNLVRQREALADDEPLHALWKLNTRTAPGC